MKPVVAVTGIMNTKGSELCYIAEQIRAMGCNTMIVDLSLGKEIHEAWIDIPMRDVLRAIGKKPEDIFSLSRGEAAMVMAEAGTKYFKTLQAEGRVHGIIAHCGSVGSAVVSPIMQALPFGFPKLLLSTSLRNYGSYVGIKDICVMYPVSECGFNKITRKIMTTAAGAIAGAALAQANYVECKDTKPLIAISQQGVTTPCGERVYDNISGTSLYDGMIIHANGTGGKSIEAMVRENWFAGLLDLNVAEYVSLRLGGAISAGEDRLSAAPECGLPEVIAPGSLDFAVFRTRDDIPEHYLKEAEQGLEGRITYFHNPYVTILSSTPDEVSQYAAELSEKFNKASAPLVICVPLRGCSGYEIAAPDISRGWAGQGPGPCWVPDGKNPEWSKRAVVFADTMRNTLDKNNEHLEVYCCDMHINDPEFADFVARVMKDIMAGGWKKEKYSSQRTRSVFPG